MPSAWGICQTIENQVDMNYVSKEFRVWHLKRGFRSVLLLSRSKTPAAIIENLQFSVCPVQQLMTSSAETTWTVTFYNPRATMASLLAHTFLATKNRSKAYTMTLNSIQQNVNLQNRGRTVMQVATWEGLKFMSTASLSTTNFAGCIAESKLTTLSSWSLKLLSPLFQTSGIWTW